MRKTLMALAAMLVASQAQAAPRDNIIAAVQKFDDAFNAGDKKAILGACTDDAIIIDDFPPHVWQGANACSTWFDDYGKDATTNGIAGGIEEARALALGHDDDRASGRPTRRVERPLRGRIWPSYPYGIP